MESEFNHTVVVDVDPVAPPTAVSPPPATRAAGEMVAGYRLEKQLGAGGYGEVWQAVGPGGLLKAVKILFGRSDGVQAETEMQSLEKVKDVRHPFILSVERIELDGDQLVIVTELAEGSLEDRFFKAQEGKKRGIPREELLAYLGDAAEALDFMRESHGLQHLDVKPANLLLQGGRVKVADFGLVKDLQQGGPSFVSGFTPLYSAPEVFGGRPSPTSDQYSLAIVYQFLQCGAAPFSGRNPVQLMSQHLNAKPDLSPLPACDRAAVARALSKTPTARFPGCRAFVEALMEKRNGRRAALPDPPAGAAQPRATGLRPLPPSSRRAGPGSTEDGPERRAASAAAPHDLSRGPASYVPTLFVGIGGWAGKVLGRLKGRLVERFGDTALSTAYPMLYLDSDPEAIASACSGSTGLELRAEDALEIRLGDAAAYRSRSPRLLEWLSRRWLFNIPRSGRVEGMRALGRLAFLDHCGEFRGRLETLLKSAARAASAAGSEALPSPLDGASLDVFVIASICGGTGSGSVLDSGYLLRSLLGSLGVRNPTLTGVLLHAPGRRPDAAQVQRANAVACLRELAHVSLDHQGYPGDKAIDLPPSSQPPFDHTCLVHWGDDCAEGDLDLAAGRLAEYLYRAAATPARAFVEKQRGDVSQEGPEDWLGTLGVGTLGGAKAEQSTEDPDALCRAVLTRWLSRRKEPPASTADGEVGAATAALFERLALTPEQLAKKAVDVVNQSVRKQAEQLFRGELRRIIAEAGAAAPCDSRLRLSVAEHFDNPPSLGLPNDHPAAMLSRFRAGLKEDARDRASELKRHILSAVDRSAQRLETAGTMISDIVARLAELGAAMQGLVRDVERDSQTIALCTDGGDAASSTGCSEGLAERYVRYAMVSFCRMLLEGISQYVADIRQQTREVSGPLLGLRVRLEEIAGHFDQPAAGDGGAMQGPCGRRAAASLLGPTEATVKAFDAMLRGQGQVRLQLLAEEKCANEAFEQRLREAAVEFVLATRSAAARTVSLAEERPAQVKGCEDAATPLLDQVGGRRRVLATVPKVLSKESWRQRLVSRFGDCVSIQSDSEDRVFVLCEVQGISPDAAALALAGGDRRVFDQASRLHTRIDVAW